MSNHVLVPVDGSEQSTEALEFACHEHPDAKITALYVVDAREFYEITGIEGAAMGDYDQILAHGRNEGEAILEAASERAAELGCDIETEYTTGKVSRSIIEYAGEHDIDRIVIGSHGRTGASRILLGSVAEAVARRSPVSVTIVR